MAKIIGIDLGTTYSAVAIWDEKKQEPVIIPNLRGNRTTPSIVSVNEAGEVIVGEEARQNLYLAPEDTVSEIKREMGNDFKVKMRGQVYNPQTISAFILHYLKQCAENYLGEPVHDAVITVPAYFTEVQKSATRDAGRIAGLNVHQLINEPTSAAITYGVTRAEPGEEKVYAVYDFGGGTFDVSIIEVRSDDVAVVGTGGDMRLGGLDMDEAVMRWALREIQQKYGVDLRGDDAAKRRLKVEAEDIKKALVVAENATLNIPYLTVINGKPLSPSLPISRQRFDMLITSLIQHSLKGLEEAMASAKERNDVGWEKLDGVLLVGGPTRILKIRDMLRQKLEEHRPGEGLGIRSDLNPDEVVAMGAAILAAQLKPIGHPPEEVEEMTAEEVKEIQRAAEGVAEAPKIDILDVTGHSLGIAVEGYKFHVIISKESPIPVTMAQAGFTNAADMTTELKVEVYQGEEPFVAANTKIGEVLIGGLRPLPRGHHQLEVKFHLDPSGTLSTVCTDLLTGRTYEGSFVFDGITRMSEEEIRAKRAMVRQMAGVGPTPAGPGPVPPRPGPVPPGPAPAAAIPMLDPSQIPGEWRHSWLEGQELLPRLDPARKALLTDALARFAQAVLSGNEMEIEDKAFLLQDVLIDVKL
jgi:molecular chaperone DnaK